MVSPNNNVERRAARKIAAEQGINYTAALRQVRNSSSLPSAILRGGVQQIVPDVPFGDLMEKMLREANHKAPGFEVTSNSLDFVREYSASGRFAVKTFFSDDSTEKHHYVESTHLALCGGAHSGSKLLEGLVLESGLSESNLVVWDSTGDWDDHEEIKVHADLHSFNTHLKSVLDRGYMNGTTTLVAINGIDDLLFYNPASQPEEKRVAVELLTKVLLEGRQRNVALYTAGTDSLFGSPIPLSRYLSVAAQVVFMQDHSLGDLPVVKGWLMTAGSATWWQVRVPKTEAV